jgi:hypothetical protein
MTFNPRKQKKNKVNVCSILVNRKKKYNMGSNDLNDFWVCFYFWENFEVLL